MYDLVTVGNALIDSFLTINPESSHTRYDKDSKELCIKSGEKILLEDCQFFLGGNACNVAIGVARTGLQTALVAEIGDDEFAEKIINGLTKDHVDTTHIKKQGQSSFAVGIQVGADRTLFIEHRERPHDFSFEGVTTKWLYLTSVGNEWKKAYEKTLSYIKENKVQLAFSPGTLQLREPLEFFKPYLAQSAMLFLNKEEAKRLLHTEEQEIKKLLTGLKNHGPEAVVITDGAEGAYAIDTDGNTYKAESKKVTVIEKTGAGDSFASGVMAGILRGKTLSEALQWGSLNAASVISHVGAQQGLKASFEGELPSVSPL